MGAFRAPSGAGASTRGGGILLVRKLVDELVYNERGNEVILINYTDR